MAAIPKDPVMLMSFLNTQLRDNYKNLKDLCGAYDLKEEELVKKLEMIDYHYDVERNQFV